jgi:glycosyltransferase involved in cell wall biosynthesis
MKPSIITINRNNEKGLEDTIKSVFGQGFTVFEYIIIDGASTDGSVGLIKKYADKINYWISEPDKGIYNAMNKGISIAKGEYLLFLNSGDTLFDTSILQIFLNTDYSEDIIYGNIIYDGDKSPLIMPDEITLNTFLGGSIGHGASFIKSELFKKYGLYNEDNKIVSDWEFFINAFLKFGCSYRHVDKIFTKYQKSGISVNPLYNNIQAEERNRVLKKNFPLFYDIIFENFSLKDELAFYQHSRIIQLFKKLQLNRLNTLRNKYFRSKRK